MVAAVAPREEVREGRDGRHGAEEDAEEQGEGHGAQCTQTSELEKWARASSGGQTLGGRAEAGWRVVSGIRAGSLPVVYTLGVHATPTSAAHRVAPLRATVEQWLAIPEEKRAELIDGRIVYHALPGPGHGFTQGWVFARLGPYNRRSGGPGQGGGGAVPGGWWISLEVDMLIGGVGCRPDVIGWRRDKNTRVPEPDKRGVVTVVPDIICEVISSSTARYDQGAKRDAYFHAGVSHYWLVDPIHKTLTALERTERGYLIALVAGPGDLVRAAPFDLVEIPVAELFMDEQEDPLPTAGETIEEGA